jgi:hypothetical protein
LYNLSTRITQETIRLTGYVCSRPENKRTAAGDILSWQYYRAGLASDRAAHVALEYDRKGLRGVIRLVSFDAISGDPEPISTEMVLGSIDDLVHRAADFLDELKVMTHHPHEKNLTACILYDNGFLPCYDGLPGSENRYWAREDRYANDCWQIIRPNEKSVTINHPDDTCEVNYGSLQVGGWTCVKAKNLRMAIGMLDGGIIPRPRKAGFVNMSQESILSDVRA